MEGELDSIGFYRVFTGFSTLYHQRTDATLRPGRMTSPLRIKIVVAVVVAVVVVVVVAVAVVVVVDEESTTTPSIGQ